MTVVLSELKNKDDFTKFTVLACYCIYFSNSIEEYERMLLRVSGLPITDFDDIEEILDKGEIALKMMKPKWRFLRGKDIVPEKTFTEWISKYK